VFIYRKLYNCTYNAFHPLPSIGSSTSRLPSFSDFGSSIFSKTAVHWINQEFERALQEQEKKGDSNFLGFFTDFPNVLNSSRLEWIGAGEKDKKTGKVYYEGVIWRGVIFSLGRTLHSF
jgi:hypothetical protein